MKIRKVDENKKQFLSLLLLTDEQESMVDRYLEKGTLYVLEEDGEVKAECVITDEGAGFWNSRTLRLSRRSRGKATAGH